MRSATTRCVACIAWLAILIVATAGRGAAQGNCSRNNNGSCTFGDDVSHSIELTVSRAVRLLLSSASITLDAPDGAAYDAGFGTSTGPTITVKANTGWTLLVRTLASTWSATGPTARADKPESDLQWAVAALGPYADFSTANATIASGGATAGVNYPLFFRVKYAWLLDTPGVYSIAVQFTITSP